ncbi:hypothetical protein [Methanolapillus ohkumae]|uniref:Uncharacterized protein n=1 Tax=Methanolapillus ohkumae TaxID=3028298 RepID=A0AA96ZX98_9EURY|nr:hypothetical protein MsAm2_12680 [Methanosarcinaceae archaeon Am2]
MDKKTETTLMRIFGMIFILLICAFSIYAYLNPTELSGISFLPFALGFGSATEFFAGKKEPKQKHQLLRFIIIFVPFLLFFFFITYRWWNGVPSLASTITDPVTAFLYVWGMALFGLVYGLICIGCSFYLDKIVDKIESKSKRAD